MAIPERFFSVVRYPDAVRGGHKVYTVRAYSGELCGVYNPKRGRVVEFSSRDRAQAWADVLNAGLIRSGFDGVDVLRAGERSARRAVCFPASGDAARRVVPELSDSVRDTSEDRARKAAGRQALKVSGAWWALGYAVDGSGVVTVPVWRDVRLLASLE